MIGLEWWGERIEVVEVRPGTGVGGQSRNDLQGHLNQNYPHAVNPNALGYSNNVVKPQWLAKNLHNVLMNIIRGNEYYFKAMNISKLYTRPTEWPIFA